MSEQKTRAPLALWLLAAFGLAGLISMAVALIMTVLLACGLLD
jgi:hypothetical protein